MTSSEAFSPQCHRIKASTYISCSLKPTLGAACLICLLISMILLIHMCMYTYIYIYTILYTDININFEGFYVRRFPCFVRFWLQCCMLHIEWTNFLHQMTYQKSNPHCNFSTIHYCKFSMNCPSPGIAVSTKRCLLWNKLLAEKIRPLDYNIWSTSPDKFCLIHSNDKYLTAEWFNEAARTRDTGLQLQSGLPVRWKWLTRPNQWGEVETNPTGTSRAHLCCSHKTIAFDATTCVFSTSRRMEVNQNIHIFERKSLYPT